MKTKLCILILVLAATFSGAQTNDLTSLLQQGLLEEQANRNLDAAIADYQTLAAQFDKNRQIAATAVFRLGECYRMLNKTNEAAAQYQRILKDFSDQTTLATLSRQNLTGMGMSSDPTANSDVLKRLFAQRQKEMGDGQFIGNSDEEGQEIQRIQTMIQNSPDLINAPSGSFGQYFTPLEKAASAGWLKVAAFLLDHGANINTGSALDFAANAGNRAMVEFLLSRGAEVNHKGSDSDTPLHIAAKRGFEAVVKVLLANKADANAQNQGGWTPLMSAASANHPEIVKLLLADGANPNLKDSNGRTALNCAIGNSTEIFQMLLAAKANPNTIDSQGRTPLSYAAEKDGAKVLKWLLDAKADPNGGTLDAPLLMAIHAKDTNSAELLLQAGANPNAKVLVDLNINRNGYGYTDPLWLATSEKQFPMVQLLLKYKADPNDSQTDGRPVLFSTLNDTNILEALLDAGAKVDARDSVSTISINGNEMHRNWTPLLFAMANDFPADSVKILLKHGANPNAQDDVNGQTPLHSVASWNGSRELSNQQILNLQEDLNLLLDAKVELNVRDYYGKTPLDIFKQQLTSTFLTPERKTSIAQLADLLRQHGALDVLPDWNHITVSRPSANFSQIVFDKGTNDWNQVSLFDVLGVQYNLITHIPNQMRRDASPYSNSKYAYDNSLSFPDFSNIVIRHPTADGKKWETRKVDLVRALDAGDGSANVMLQWGDVVEIPEADHVINQRWSGLTTNELLSLKNCLTRHLQITVNGQTTNFVASPQVTIQRYWSMGQDIREISDREGAPMGTIIRMEAKLLTGEPFMLWPVLDESKTLLSSSDLSRVKIKRTDAATGKIHEWTVDCSDRNSPPNFWLRDGDVIDVPEK